MKTALRAMFAVSLFLSLGATVALVPTPASASTPQLEVSAKRAATCRDVVDSPTLEPLRRRASERRELTLEQSAEVASAACRLFAATPSSRARYWDASLSTLVADGRLTASDKALLRKALIDPSVLATWKPTTKFGQQVQAGAPEADVGWVVGAIVGGIIGGAAGGVAGIAVGIGVGGAAGDLAETVFTSDGGDDSDSSDGDDDAK